MVVDQAAASRGEIEFTMGWGRGETVATLVDHKGRNAELDAGFLMYLNNASPLLLDADMIGPGWFVDTLVFSGSPVRVRVVLRRRAGARSAQHLGSGDDDGI